MKGKFQFPLAVGMVLLATKALSEESCQCCATGGFYLDGNVGVSFLPKLNVLGGEAISFNTGVRVDVAIGYHLSSWAALEFNTGVIWNSVDKIGGVPLSSFGGSMEVYQIPFMGNLVLSPSGCGRWRPYVGGGVGGVCSFVDFQSPLGNIADNDFAFGYQAFVGVNYSISSSVEIGVGYRFLQTHNHGWEENDVTLHTEGTTSHSVIASFRWKF
jgi:OOP family OmpA-OmpF porin